MFKGKKLITLLVSLLGAFLLWLYVVTTVAPETVATIANIPVTIEGISDGIVTSDGTYIMTEQITQTITLELKTSRVNMSKLNPQSIRISAYVSNSVVQNGAGVKELNYTITFPDTVNVNDIDILKQSSSTVRIEVAKMQTKTVPVELKTLNKVADGYVFERTNVTIDPKEVEITGPEGEVSQITRALVVADLAALDLSDLSVTMHEISAPFVFQNDAGEEVATSQYTSVAGNLSSARIKIPVQKMKELTLTVRLDPGGGIQESDTVLTLNTNSIKVKGVPLVIDKLEDPLVISAIDLSTALDDATLVGNDYVITYEIYLDDLPELKNVTNVSGISTVRASLTVKGIKRSNPVTVKNSQIKFVNVPSGLYAKAENTELKIVLQGPAQDIDKVLSRSLEDIVIEVDLSDVETPSSFTANGTIFIPGYPNVGIAGGTVPIDIVVSNNPNDGHTAN